MAFRALELRTEILKAIDELGYKEPTPIQIKAVPIVMKGRDVIGIAQTGTGKTAAFVWPMLERILNTRPEPATGVPVPRGLVLVPTRELAVQVFDNVVAYAKYLPIRALPIYGGVSEFGQLNSLKKGADIIVATPGRLLDFLSTMSINVKNVEFLVLDEADRMLDMGFIPDVRRILGYLPAKRQTLFFSATFPPVVEKLAKEFLNSPQVVEIGKRATPTETVAQYVFEIPKQNKAALLAHILRQYELKCVLVFVRTKIMADRLSRDLASHGVMVAALHSNRTQGQRMAALKGFKQGLYPVLVATDIAARGIDVDGISHVVNYDFPNHPEDYVHRIGRTGRALAIGDALSFVAPEEMTALRTLEKFIGRGIPRRVIDGFDPKAVRPDRSSRSGESRSGSGDSRGGRGGGGRGRDGGSPSRGGGGRPGGGGNGPGGGDRPRSSGGGQDRAAAGGPNRRGGPRPGGQESTASVSRSGATDVVPGQSAPVAVISGESTFGRVPKAGRRRR